MCTSQIVDEVTRRRIAAHGASFRQASSSPFGARDEIGMLNLMDAASAQAIMARADVGRMFDLSVDHFMGMPGWFGAGDPPYQIWMTHTPRGEEADDVMGVGRAQNELVSYSGDVVQMYTHCGTHIDMKRPGFSGGSSVWVMRPYRGFRWRHGSWLRPRRAGYARWDRRDGGC